MKPALVIFNCRLIDECMEALSALPIAKIWIKGRYATDLPWLVPKTMREYEYTHYLVTSDDVIVTQKAIDAVLGLLKEGHPISTGYCNLDQNSFSEIVNLCKTPLRGNDLAIGAYDWYSKAEIAAYPDEAVPTYFGGMTLTAMTRDRWLHYGWEQQTPGAAADFRLAKKLEAEGTPMVAAKGGFIEHVKENWPYRDTDPRKRFRHGEIPIALVHEEAA